MAKSHKRSRRHNSLFAQRRKHNPMMEHSRHHNRHRNRRHNPLDLPIPLRDAAVATVGAVGGGIAASWLPNKVLGASDSGALGYAGNAAVAVLGSLALNKYKNVSLGWLLGGLTMTFGRIFDDYFGSQVVTFNAPSAAMGSYYRNTNYALPAPVTNDLVNAAALLPALPAAMPGAAVHAGSAQLAKTKGSGMGWNPRFASRFAA